MGDEDAELQLAIRLSLEQQQTMASDEAAAAAAGRRNFGESRTNRCDVTDRTNQQSSSSLPGAPSPAAPVAVSCAAPTSAIAPTAAASAVDSAVSAPGSGVAAADGGGASDDIAAAAPRSSQPIMKRPAPDTLAESHGAKVPRRDGGASSAVRGNDPATRLGSAEPALRSGPADAEQLKLKQRFMTAFSARWGAFVHRGRLRERELVAVLVDTRRNLGDPMVPSEQQAAAILYRSNASGGSLAEADLDAQALAALLYPHSCGRAQCASAANIDKDADAGAACASMPVPPDVVPSECASPALTRPDAGTVCSSAGVCALPPLGPEAVAKKPKKVKARCAVCRKKVGLTGFMCKCGKLHCGAHRYSGSHGCTFDYKAESQALLQKRGKEEAELRAKKVARI
eukprot:SAG31_NODE_1412_length_8463_cov_6.657102_5_plen_399_part_00